MFFKINKLSSSFLGILQNNADLFGVVYYNEAAHELKG